MAKRARMAAGRPRQRKSPAWRRGFDVFTPAAGSGGLARIHEAVEGLLLDPEPFVLDGEERLPLVVDLLELRVARRFLGIKLLRRVVAGFHDRLRETAELRA